LNEKLIFIPKFVYFVMMGNERREMVLEKKEKKTKEQ
jgi:hypothetical protein